MAKQRIKIGVPLVSQYDSDEDEPSEKKLKSSTNSKVGLFSLLPPPKTTPLSTKSFIPNVIRKRANIPSSPQAAKPIAPAKVKTKKLPNNKPEEKGGISESDDDLDEDLPVTFDVETWEKVCGRPKRSRPTFVGNSKDIPAACLTHPVVEAAPETKEPYRGLDNEAFKALVGTGRRRENIKLIDINEEEIRPDRAEWLKGLTDPACDPKPAIDNPVNDTCKKKHHITYLAEQAKSQEKELQTQWSNSRFTRKQTQAKYGF